MCATTTISTKTNIFQRDYTRTLNAFMLEQILSPQAQSFSVHPFRTNSHESKQGTKIEIAPNSFQYPNGRIVKERVHLHIKEIYTRSDLVRQNLETRSGTKLLETGGMLYIEACAADTPVSLVRGKQIKITLPKKMNTLIKGKNISYGSRKGSRLNWSQARNLHLETHSCIRNRPCQQIFGSDLQYYFLSPQLGWFNFDSYTRTSRSFSNSMMVHTPGVDNAIIQLLYQSKSILVSGETQHGKAILPDLPIDAEVYLIGMAYKDQIPYFAMERRRVSEYNLWDLDLSISTREMIQDQLQNLDKVSA